MWAIVGIALQGGSHMGANLEAAQRLADVSAVQLLRAAAEDVKASAPPSESAAAASDVAAILEGLPAADRKWVFIVGLSLVGLALVIAAIATLVLVSQGKSVPNEFWILVSSVVTGALGGLFGYSAQKR